MKNPGQSGPALILLPGCATIIHWLVGPIRFVPRRNHKDISAMWIILALVSAAILGVVNLTDKRLLDHHLPGVSTLYLWIVLVLLVYIGGGVAVTGVPRDAALGTILAALASGIGLGLGYALLFVGLKVDEASRAVAITQVYPIFVALLAVLFLGEILNVLQWAAIILVALGTMLVSLPGIPNRLAELKPTGGVPILLGSGLMLGLGFFAAKVALEETSLRTVFIYQQAGTLLVFLPFSHPGVWRQLFAALRDRKTLFLMVVGEGILPLIALLAALQAASLGPISLVSAFLATTPLFVFVLATLLSQSRWNLMGEAITRRALTLKFSAIVMIVIGVSALGLFQG